MHAMQAEATQGQALKAQSTLLFAKQDDARRSLAAQMHVMHMKSDSL